MIRGGSQPSACSAGPKWKAGVPVPAVVEALGARLPHGRQVLSEIARIGLELDLAGDGQAEPNRLVTEEVGVVASRGARLPEEPHLAEALLVEPVGADHTFGRDVAVGDREAVVGGKPASAGPAQAGHAELVRRVLQDQRVVRDHRPQHDDAALVDQPPVALDDLLVVLAGQATGVGDHQLHGRAGPDSLVQGVLDGKDRGVDPVGQQLIEVHVDQHADLHGFEGVTLRRDAAGRRVDRDVLDRLVAGRTGPFVPGRGVAAAPLEVRPRPVLDRGRRRGQAQRSRDRRARERDARRIRGCPT